VDVCRPVAWGGRPGGRGWGPDGASSGAGAAPGRAPIGHHTERKVRVITEREQSACTTHPNQHGHHQATPGKREEARRRAKHSRPTACEMASDEDNGDNEAIHGVETVTTGSKTTAEDRVPQSGLRHHAKRVHVWAPCAGSRVGNFRLLKRF
jgi:hypothetical protein